MRQQPYELRERLARTDKYLARLYKLNANLGHKINRVQRERMRIVQQLEVADDSSKPSRPS